jgi:hypothetical protein
MIEIFTMDMFSGDVGGKYLMHYGEGKTAELELISAADVGSSARQVQFSLEFRAPVDAPLAQGSYRIDHDKLGTLDLFLVPIGRDQKGVRYEAIFNRVIE